MEIESRALLCTLARALPQLLCRSPIVLLNGLFACHVATSDFFSLGEGETDAHADRCFLFRMHPQDVTSIGIPTAEPKSDSESCS